MDVCMYVCMYVCTIAYDGSAARSLHQPEEDTATEGELGLLSARSIVWRMDSWPPKLR